MKKAFTLIEIIISIVIIVVIGISTLIIASTKKTNNEINDITKNILESAKVYLETEIDENGNSYKKGLLSGGTAVVIPLSQLKNEGYINEQTITTLEKIGISQQEFILAAVFSDANDVCTNSDSIINFEASWNEKLKNETDTIYICDYSTSKISNIVDLNTIMKFKVDLTKYATENNENGVYTLYDENVQKVYTYYRGKIDNNYLELGTKDGEKLLWRVLWFNDDNYMKLILNEEVHLTAENTAGEFITIDNNSDGTASELVSFSNYGYNIYKPTITQTKIESNSSYTDKYYDIVYEEKYLFKNFIYFNDNIEMNSSNNFYYNNMKKWYESTNLNEFSYITTESNFCKNNYYTENLYGKTYYQSDNFTCISGNKSIGNLTYNSTLYSSPIGYITYGEALRAGLSMDTSANTNIVSSGNFLLSDSRNSYPLIDRQRYYQAYDGYARYEDYDYYYINNSGLKYSKFYIEERDSNDNSTFDIYSIKDSEGNIKQKDIETNENNSIMKTTKFYANTIKPAIVVDLSEKSIIGAGTENDPFKIVDKVE